MKLQKLLYSVFLFLVCGLATHTQAQIITTVAGNGTAGNIGNGSLAIYAELNYPVSVAVSSSGNIFISDQGNGVIRKVDHTTGIISALPNVWNYYSLLGGIAVDGSGNVYFADGNSREVYKVNGTGAITLFAGNGIIGGSLGLGGPATDAELDVPQDVAVDGSGNVYIADGAFIYKVNTTGIITAFAGAATGGLYSGDGGPATAAGLAVSGIATDGSGNVYIADGVDNVIRKVNTSGIITTIAGNGVQGYSGDGGLATLAELYGPNDIVVDGSGNVYIADMYNNSIRKVSTSGIITTIAGANGIGGYSGDGVPAMTAELSLPQGIAIDGSNNIYIADFGNHRVRKIIMSGTGINAAPDSHMSVQLFPNPNTGIFTLQGTLSDHTSHATITIVNAVGQVVYTDNADVRNGKLYRQISTQLPDGIYLLNIAAGQDKETMRFSIVK